MLEVTLLVYGRGGTQYKLLGLLMLYYSWEVIGERFQEMDKVLNNNEMNVSSKQNLQESKLDQYLAT